MSSFALGPQPTSGSVSGSVVHNPNAILVHECMRNYPRLLAEIKHAPLQMMKGIVPDFVISDNTCALYISTTNHTLYPTYLPKRIRELGRAYKLRTLVCLVESDDNVKCLEDINKLCFTSELTLILAWSVVEAARYIESLKALEKKGPASIKGKVETEFLPTLNNALTSIKSINKTDVMTLLDAFTDFRGITQATDAQLLLCPGLGMTKVQAISGALSCSFRKKKKL